MAERAHLTSLDALEGFRVAMILYVEKARPAVEEVVADVQRARAWLEDEQRPYWQNQLRRRSRELEQAQQALFSARLSTLSDATAAEINAVHRAKNAVQEAEDKLRRIKLWTRDFDSKLQPLVKQLEKLHTVLSADLPKGILRLSEIAKLIETYSEPGPPSSGPVESGSSPPATHA